MESSLLSLTPFPFLDGIIWIVLLISALYLARKPFHRAADAVSRLIYNAMRLGASSVRLAEKQLQMRNREVLVTAGLELAERRVEREFQRISADVRRDLEGYPHLQRTVTEALLKIEEDYAKSAAVPQALPDWVKVIDAVANIKPSGDRMVVNMLEEIHQTLSEQHRTAVERHRRDMADRHAILSRMLPFWRGVQKTLSTVEKAIGNLNQRSHKIDRYMESYEKIVNRSDAAYRQLAASSLTQFFVSTLVLAVAAVGAVINFNLVALPMTEMVGGSSFIGGFKTSDVAGVFLVGLQIVIGLFIMDALRITRFFSVIGSMEEKKRKILFWVLLLFLVLLASMEASLAFLRDRLVNEMEALRQALSGDEAGPLVSSNIPTIGQMIMGFTLPFVLAFVAIPFESFVASARTAIGMVAAWAMRATAFVLRLSGSVGYHAGRLISRLYDLVVFPALWLEEVLAARMCKFRERKARAAAAGDREKAGSPSVIKKQARPREALE